MRCAFFLLLLVGCSTWRPTYLTSVVPDPGEEPKRAFIVTEGEAYEVDVVSRDAWSVQGKARRAWVMTPGTIAGIDVTDKELATGESPDATAERFGWEEVALPAGTIAIPIQGIRHVRGLAVSEHRVAGIAGGIGAGVMCLFVAAIIIGGTLGGGMSGRPLRVDGVSRVATVTRREDWSQVLVPARIADSNVRAELARVWTAEAQAEHASIAAFAKLSLELVAVGAPPHLIARAHRAALQEIEHARMCFAIASRYAGESVGPGPLDEATSRDSIDIERLATEALVDGWLGEGLAAELAELGMESASDPTVASVLRTQALDEASHAQLSRDIVEWCLARQTDERKAGELRERLVASLHAAPTPRPTHLPEHGRIGGEIAALRFEALRTEILKDLTVHRGKYARPHHRPLGTVLE